MDFSYSCPVSQRVPLRLSGLGGGLSNSLTLALADCMFSNSGRDDVDRLRRNVLRLLLLLVCELLIIVIVDSIFHRYLILVAIIVIW